MVKTDLLHDTIRRAEEAGIIDATTAEWCQTAVADLLNAAKAPRINAANPADKTRLVHFARQPWRSETPRTLVAIESLSGVVAMASFTAAELAAITAFFSAPMSTRGHDQLSIRPQVLERWANVGDAGADYLASIMGKR